MVGVGESAALASRMVGRPLAGERAVEVDQSNESVVVADEVVVKWLVPPVPAPHAGVELLEYLEHQGFRHMPALVGVETRHDMVVAIATRYLPGAQDGWDWYVDEIDAHLRGERSLDDVLGWARRMATVTAELHTCLKGLGRSSVSARAYHAHALRSLVEAVRTVEGDEGASLRGLVGRVEAALEPLHVDRLLPAHRVHGDLHVGQFLRSGDVLLLTDFDGNPLADPVERRLPQSPMKDLAALLQSIDHVGRIVVKRRHPDRQDDVDAVVAAAIAAAQESYVEQLPVDLGILHALRVAQELHEYLYAATSLPRWMYVPHAALPALLGGEG